MENVDGSEDVSEPETAIQENVSEEPDLSEIDNILNSMENIDDSEAVSESDDTEKPDLNEIDDILNSIDINKTAEVTELDDVISEELDSAEHNSNKIDDEQPNDLLAKQLSDVAFKENVPLPKVETSKENDFIDIETLLESSNNDSKDEPYSELNIDLGLDEFPDVIGNENNISINDGENEISAQLDLARAYLEIDDKSGAKEILLSVFEGSEGKQRAEIEKLLNRLTQYGHVILSDNKPAFMLVFYL